MNELKKEDITPGDWEFEFQQRGEQPILLSDWYCRGIAGHMGEAFALGTSAFDYMFTSSSKGYVNTGHKQAILSKQRDAFLGDEYVAYVLRNAIEVPKRFGGVGRKAKILAAKQNPSAQELAALWEEIDREFIRMMPWFWVPYYPSEQNVFTDKVKAGLERNAEKVRHIADTDDALALISSYAEDTQFLVAVDEYRVAYGYLSTFLLMPLDPISQEEVIGRIARAVQEESWHEYVKQQEVKQKNEKIVAQLLVLLSDDWELVKDIGNARELGYALTMGVELALRHTADCLPLLRIIAERVGLPYSDIKYFLSSEILDALKGETRLSPSVARERSEGYVMMTSASGLSALFGREGKVLADWVDGELRRVPEGISEFRGQVACKGRAVGKVCLALEPAVSHKLKDGEILVCPMTNPDYVPAMKRAAAIVTDEGGLLSHAAIMSREFNKPCVIATKIATQVLHDGDLVEVDAQNGLVKVLESAKYK